jgi:hypothetical protein
MAEVREFLGLSEPDTEGGSREVIRPASKGGRSGRNPSLSFTFQGQFWGYADRVFWQRKRWPQRREPSGEFRCQPILSWAPGIRVRRPLDLGHIESGNSSLSPGACRAGPRPLNWPYRRLLRSNLSRPLETRVGAH